MNILRGSEQSRNKHTVLLTRDYMWFCICNVRYFREYELLYTENGISSPKVVFLDNYVDFVLTCQILYRPLRYYVDL